MAPEVDSGQKGRWRLTAQHVIVGIVCDGIDMGWGLATALALVSSDHRGSVDGQPLIRVHGDTEQTRVGLQE